MQLNILYGVLILAAFGFLLGFLCMFVSKYRNSIKVSESGSADPVSDSPRPEPRNSARTKKRTGLVKSLKNPAETKAAAKTVVVKCVGGDRAVRKYNYDGIKDCSSALLLSGGPVICEYGCVGLGSCVKACEAGAISISGGVACVNQQLCTSCLKCIDSCPRNLLVQIPFEADVMVVCSLRSDPQGREDICSIGCVACGECERVCRNGAIRIQDSLAVIDYSKCSNCGDCAEKCPRRLIVDARMSSQYQRRKKTDN